MKWKKDSGMKNVAPHSGRLGDRPGITADTRTNSP